MILPTNEGWIEALPDPYSVYDSRGYDCDRGLIEYSEDVPESDSKTIEELTKTLPKQGDSLLKMLTR